MCVLSAGKFLPKGLVLFALICLYFHLVPWDCSSLTLKSMLGLQVSLDVALLIQGVLITQEVELGCFFFGRLFKCLFAVSVCHSLPILQLDMCLCSRGLAVCRLD